MKKRLIILGATGSIGTTALTVLPRFTDQIELVGISAHTNHVAAVEIARKWGVQNIALNSCENAMEFNCFPSVSELIKNTDADIVLNGIAGSAGLLPSLTALNCKMDLALANKESIILAGKLLFDTAKANHVNIIPVDSEHSAIYELLKGKKHEDIASLIITASGGPFRTKNRSELQHITVKQALNHPTWKMGPKITVDSATLANKGLEVIEAGFLFDFDPSQIKVVLHPQSIVHSMVQMKNGQIYAQLSPPNMAFPIINGILYNEAITKEISEPLDFTKLDLSFSTPGLERFPFLKCAFKSLNLKKAYPLAYNIADEVAVKAFFEHKISFTRIDEIVQDVLQKDWFQEIESYQQIQILIRQAKEETQKLI